MLVAPEDEHSDGHVTDEEADAAAPATSSDVEPDALVIGNDSDDDDQDATEIVSPVLFRLCLIGTDLVSDCCGCFARHSGETPPRCS